MSESGGRPGPWRPLRTIAIAVVAHALLVAGGSGRDPAFWAASLTSFLVVIATLPLVMTAALAAVSVVLAIVLAAISAPVAPFRRTGLAGLLGELFALSAPIVPRYYGSLFAIRSPWFWGLVIGGTSAAFQLTNRVAIA